MIVRDAARATLAAGTARVWQVRWIEGADAPQTQEEGETEFARCRTRTTIEHAPPPPEWDRLAGSLPWLFGEADDDAPVELNRMLYAGTASWTLMPGREPSNICRGDVDAGRRGHTDPTWIVEVMGHASEEQRLAAGHVRFLTDLAQSGAPLELPPHRGRQPPRIVGEAWLDDAGRVARATWRRADRTREEDGERRVRWTTTDLWDFGTPVEIPRPEPEPYVPLPVVLGQVAGTLWRRKRAYERRA
jgi:hypothetical protein